MGECETNGCTVDDRMVREVLGWIADKWTLVLIEELGDETLRFNELRRRVGDISQKVLTGCLREMERNGLVTRTVYAEVPPRVEYRLTEMGAALSEASCPVWSWTERYGNDVLAARGRFRKG